MRDLSPHKKPDPDAGKQKPEYEPTELEKTALDRYRAQKQNRQLLSHSSEIIPTMFRRAESASGDAASLSAVNVKTLPDSGIKADASAVEFARCFLRLANLPNFALDRLSRYEATLWRQAGRILYALDPRSTQTAGANAGAFGMV
jgi:hypothetical protein